MAMTTERIDPRTAIRAVHLTVSDLERSLDFYTETLGTRVLSREGSEASLGAADRAPLLVLRGDPDAPPRPRRTTGLFHFAILLPQRRDLARSLRRLAERGWPVSGASDHLVSEAVYLDDPDGIGIEIYRDRPREEWEFTDEGVSMATIPLDIGAVMGELGDDDLRWDGLPAGTRIGHVHLNVADLGDAERFYSGTLGFEVTVRNYPGALFVSAGGYHHHIGLNVWNGEGAPPPPEGSIGLDRYSIVVPDRGELERIAGRLEGAAEIQTADGALLTRDPSGIGVEIAGEG
jgi:catechol 2,3-dioxygenase